MTEDRIRYFLTHLILSLQEDDVSEAELQELEILLQTEPCAVTQYVQILKLYMELSPQGSVGIPVPPTKTNNYDDLLQMLANEEKSAPAVEIEKPTHPRVYDVETIQVVRRQSNGWQFKKRSLISFMVSAAAVLLLVLFARYAPPKMGLPVATLLDSMNAKWADTSIKPGDRLTTSSDSLILKEGLIKILFDNQTSATLEAPSKFRILTSDQIMLDFGKIYIQVPKQAYGFSVCTPNSKIIDLGTEFGVQIGIYDTEVHVTKGKVAFMTGFKGNRINQEIQQGTAEKISSVSGRVEAINFNPHLFVRQISSDQDVMWRGEEWFDLADIVGGGNGFGTGQRGACISPVNGEWLPQSPIRAVENYGEGQQITGEFHKVSALPLVDGVFVPKADEGPVYVSSEKHVFEQAPETRGVFWGGVINVDQIIGQDIMLNGVTFGTPQRPALFMHSNIGITFDLQAIRKQLPGRSIDKFSSICGISESFTVDSVPYADFWVLVDGDLRFSRTNVTLFQKEQISVPLSETDRFLTLITTQGDEKSQKGQKAYNDWCIYGMPRLVIK